MNLAFITGILGSLILVVGAACPEPKNKVHPTKSLKNWLLAIGGIIMFIYALLNFQQGGQIFFVILEILVVIASIMMMLDTKDTIDSIIIALSGIGLLIWSLILFEDHSTVIFILGLTGVGLGYVFKMATLRRIIALTLGSTLIAIFSLIEANWIYFWLNTFFAIFSAFYLIKIIFAKNLPGTSDF